MMQVESPYRAPRNGSVIAADGADVALVTASVVDAAGNVVPSGAGAGVNVTFSVASGPGVVLGTSAGDPADHVGAHSPTRPAFHGVVRAIVASAAPGATGVVLVSASAPGLSSATVELLAA